MRITCKSCGHENELGRVFCMECGKRLDLTETSIQEMRKDMDTGIHIPIGKLIGTVVLLIVAASIGLALWPRIPFLRGEATGAEKVKEGMRTLLQAAFSVQKKAVVFDQGDVNAYLAGRAPEIGVSSVSVSFGNGRMVVRAVETIGPFGPVGPFKYSYDMLGVPAGMDIAFSKGSVGHLPIPFGLHTLVSGGLEEAYLSSKEKKFFERVSNITVSEGKLELSVAK